jgi:hypothetical protein
MSDFGVVVGFLVFQMVVPSVSILHHTFLPERNLSTELIGSLWEDGEFCGLTSRFLFHFW